MTSLQKVLLAIAVVSMVVFAWFGYERYIKPKGYGTVIILNGPSGVGKSSIQRQFQQLMMPDLWIKLGIDNLFDAPMPDITPENMQVWQSPNPMRWVDITPDAHGNNVVTLHVGDQGRKVIDGMHEAIAAYARAGNNVIVDYILYDPAWLPQLVAALKDVPVIFVGVRASLQTIEEREKARATSPVGHARSHYDIVHAHGLYDLELDADKLSPKESAQELAGFVRSGKKRQVFEKLAVRPLMTDGQLARE